MLKNWAKNKCLKGLMMIMSAEENQWFEIDNKEYKVVNGEIYSRPLVLDMLAVGAAITNLDNDSPLRNTFQPRLDSVYYYWSIDAETKEWELRCRMHHDQREDKGNIAARNCFPDKESANEWREALIEILN